MTPMDSDRVEGMELDRESPPNRPSLVIRARLLPRDADDFYSVQIGAAQPDHFRRNAWDAWRAALRSLETVVVCALVRGDSVTIERSGT